MDFRYIMGFLLFSFLPNLKFKENNPYFSSPTHFASKYTYIFVVREKLSII